MSLWIFDTDHVSLVLRGHPKVTARLGNLSAQTSTSIITVQEIFNGWMGELNQPNPKRDTILEQYHHLFLAVELLKSLPSWSLMLLLLIDMNLCSYKIRTCVKSGCRRIYGLLRSHFLAMLQSSPVIVEILSKCQG